MKGDDFIWALFWASPRNLKKARIKKNSKVEIRRRIQLPFPLVLRTQYRS